MQVKILSFGILKNVFPASTMALEDATTVGGLLVQLQRELAARPGPIVRLLGNCEMRLDWLVREQAVAINTAAAGGNASLMTIG